MSSERKKRTVYLGIDFGNDRCCVAAYRNSYADVVPDDHGSRKTPTYVTLSSNERLMGMAAKNQAAANLNCTVSGIKRLLGEGWKLEKDKYYPKLPSTFTLEANKIENTPIIKVEHRKKEHKLRPEQLAAMLFTKLQKWTKTILDDVGKMVCVISVPCYFTQAQRMAILNSAYIAGLQVNRVISDMEAICFTYGWSMNFEDTEKTVAFVEMGHTSLQVSICKVSYLRAEVVALEVDSELGGRDFDIIMSEHILEKFCRTHEINKDEVKRNKGACLRLYEIIEEYKKKISINKTTFPLKLEAFVNDKDLTGEISRALMMEACKELIERARHTMQRCLEKSRLNKKDIHATEAVGGCTRIPAIKEMIEDVFGSLTTTMNKDETIAIGCALQCGAYNISNVKTFKVMDQLYHPMTLHFNNEVSIPLGHNTATPFKRKYSIRCSNQQPHVQQLIVAYCANKEGTVSCIRSDIVYIESSIDHSMLDLIIGVDKNGLVRCYYKCRHQNDIKYLTCYEDHVDKDGRLRCYNKKDELWAVTPVSVFRDGLEGNLKEFRKFEEFLKKADERDEINAAARNTLEEYIYSVMSQNPTDNIHEKLMEILNWAKDEDHTKEIYEKKLTELKAFIQQSDSATYTDNQALTRTTTSHDTSINMNPTEVNPPQ